MYVGNDRTVFAEKGVEQGALAGVGGSCYSDRNAVLDGVAETEGVDETTDVRDDFDKQIVKSRPVCKLDFLFAEVELEFHQ